MHKTRMHARFVVRFTRTDNLQTHNPNQKFERRKKKRFSTKNKAENKIRFGILTSIRLHLVGLEWWKKKTQQRRTTISWPRHHVVQPYHTRTSSFVVHSLNNESFCLLNCRSISREPNPHYDSLPTRKCRSSEISYIVIYQVYRNTVHVEVSPALLCGIMKLKHSHRDGHTHTHIYVDLMLFCTTL